MTQEVNAVITTKWPSRDERPLLFIFFFVIEQHDERGENKELIGMR